MIKYLAILCKNGRGKVLNVAEGEIRRVVAKENQQAAPSSASILIRVMPRRQ